MLKRGTDTDMISSLLIRWRDRLTPHPVLVTDNPSMQSFQAPGVSPRPPQFREEGRLWHFLPISHFLITARGVVTGC